MNNTYTVSQLSVDTIIAKIRSKEIAIPEIQRPFVWDTTKVRDLVDSLHRGYPTGYLITWQNPNVRIKGGGTSAGKLVLIDGQQRVTAIMASLAGQVILNSEYEKRRIKIAFNPMAKEGENNFEVLTPIIEKDSRWIPDISVIFDSDFSSYSYVSKYQENNPECDADYIHKKIQELTDLKNRQLGIITINPECSVDEVTEIFIRINSQGAVLSQADFAMSKIAADDQHDGAMLRKAIDYYCHLAKRPEFWGTLENNDADYMATEYARLSRWLKDDREDIYDPDYSDVLRVSFMYGFGRGKLANLVSLLSGRDFEARDYKQEIADRSFATLTECVKNFMKESNFKDFMMAIRSAGFTSSKMVYSQNAIDFAYNLYLTLRESDEVDHTEVKRYVQRWYVMSLLTGRYSAAPESRMDFDIRNITERGFLNFYNEIISANLGDNYWDVGLIQQLRTTSTRTGAWLVYLAANIKNATNTLFSNSVKFNDIVATLGDVHHIFPKAYLQRELNAPRRVYNQVANYTYLEKHTNIAISDSCPAEYFTEAKEAAINGEPYFGNVYGRQEFMDNIADSCIPEGIFKMTAENYEDFLEQRRVLMAKKIKDYFYSL